MSEPIPESVPTSADPRSKRPTKRRALTPGAQHANQVTSLFAKPDREIAIADAASVAAAAARRSQLPAPPEIVANVQGSSAGAGSGEFHVYKASRRREYERVKMMDEEVAKEQADAEFNSRQAERREKDEAKTSKNRRKREKMKAKKGNGDGAAMTLATTNQVEDTAEDAGKRGNQTTAPTSNPDEIGITIHDDD